MAETKATSVRLSDDDKRFVKHLAGTDVLSDALRHVIDQVRNDTRSMPSRLREGNIIPSNFFKEQRDIAEEESNRPGIRFHGRI